MKTPADVLKAWRAELLLTRGLTAPNAKPLYSYQVTAHEFAWLRGLLKAHRDHASHYLYGDSWASAFCMFVAESYRREYNGGEDGWAWNRFEKELDCQFSPQQRADIVERGLEYWRRPVRRREGRRELLGSLCIEGGLPWPLVQSDRHGFGRTVRRGLKYFYRTEGGGRTTADLIAESEDDLPLTFRNLDTRQLLAGVVEQLMFLVRQYSLKDQPDPAAYLDQHAKGWRAAFPIPLDETNARSLVNDWLRDAGRRNQERKESLERERKFGCEHRLVGGPENWSIRAEVTIPAEETFAVDVRSLGGTRLALAFYEGERLIVQGGPVYGHLGDGTMTVRYSISQFSLERSNLREPLTLRLLESGRPVHVVSFDGSQLDLNEVPLVFESRDGQRWLTATASCRIAAQSAWIRLPPTAVVTSGSFQELGTDLSGGRWGETLDDLTIRKGGELYQIGLKREGDPTAQLSLNGHFALYDSRPGTVFVGCPSLEVPEGSQYDATDLDTFENGLRVIGCHNRKRAGVIRYAVRTRQGETILQRFFGVLPEGFSLQLFPSVAERPARIVLRNARGVMGQVRGEGLSAQQEVTEDGPLIYLQCRTREPPSRFDLELATPGETEPVTLRLDYPHLGARLIDCESQPLDTDALTIDELVGTRVALSTSSAAGQEFHLQFDLFSRDNLRLRRRHVVRVTDVPVLVGLFSYLNDIQQMLGAVDEQDAYLRLTVETDHELLRVNIRRYNGMLRRNNGSSLAVEDMKGRSVLTGVVAEAMLLSNPKREAVRLTEFATEGVGTGVFAVPTSTERDGGPWLIYPSKTSKVKFRPELHAPPGIEDGAHTEPQSLHEAASMFHPVRCPDVIDRQIEAMATNFDHSGWQYLDDLRRHFGHLPLSTFESWRSLSCHSEALAAAVFRLEIDETFCGRARDELAVLWECIPLSVWVSKFAEFRKWLGSQGLPETFVAKVLDNRRIVLKTVVPGFDHIGNYLATGDRATLSKPPIALVLPHHYQELRRNHEADGRWPTELGQELATWVNQQPLPLSIRRLSKTEYSDAVTYLPIFMAYVTAGKTGMATLQHPLPYLKFVVRKISDFDRHGWYLYVHAIVISYLLASESSRGLE